jgi:hypothetical protein
MAMRKVLVPLAFVAAGACGPSYQTIYENDARFEHCYAIDDSATSSLDQKAKCWKDWKEHHTFGQTRDRVEYAQSRFVALNSTEMPTDEAMMHAAPGEVGEHTQLTAPTPTNAFAPPEAMAAVDAGTRASPPPTITAFVAPPPPPPPPVTDAGAPVRPRAAICTDDCTRSFQECKSSRDAGACDDGYDRCVVNCVKRQN